MAEESSPPERSEQTGTSLIRRSTTPASSSSPTRAAAASKLMRGSGAMGGSYQRWRVAGPVRRHRPAFPRPHVDDLVDAERGQALALRREAASAGAERDLPEAVPRQVEHAPVARPGDREHPLQPRQRVRSPLVQRGRQDLGVPSGRELPPPALKVSPDAGVVPDLPVEHDPRPPAAHRLVGARVRVQDRQPGVPQRQVAEDGQPARVRTPVGERVHRLAEAIREAVGAHDPAHAAESYPWRVRGAERASEGTKKGPRGQRARGDPPPNRSEV